MKYEFFIALRYIFGKRREKFISIITGISILGVSVGVAALIATLAVMNGFDGELRARIIGSNPHIFVEKESGIANADAISKEINNIHGVKGSFPYMHSQAIVKFRNRAKGIVIKSIDTANEIDASKLTPYLISVAANMELGDGIIIGNEFASALGIYITDEISLITPASQRQHKMLVTGIYKSGMYDYDANVAYSGLSNLSNMFDAKLLVSGVGVDCLSPADCDAIKEKIENLLGNKFFVSTWIQRNRNLFSAIKLEKLTMFMILTLIVIVACFSIIGVLVMTVMEKRKDIGILKALGASKRSIVAIFSIQGFIIGFTGVIFGLMSGFGVSLMLKKFVKLPPQVYYIDSIPIKFNITDSVIIVAAALFVSLLATIYPAYQASRLDPVQTLRYE